MARSASSSRSSHPRSCTAGSTRPTDSTPWAILLALVALVLLLTHVLVDPIAQRFDSNHSGELDEAELAQAITQLAAPQTASVVAQTCLLYTSPSPRDRTRSRMPSSA
eukprot:TRINITY_DN18895_c0_g2_i1.p2 TRINITY_DN18895_c0_g2~~TRINITY_DN18895_c0_g2_i1.p2  ORF type:complete len:108 (-),score=10.58 TRINITY_DN18895_c0_g2_i1:44-367(-)